MSTLGEIGKIAHNITNSALKAVKALHVVAYGNHGEPRKVRKALRAFAGFGFDIDSDEFRHKLNEVKVNLEFADLVSICNILDLDYSGTHENVVVRICSFMNDLQIDDVAQEESVEEEEELEDEADDERDEDENVNKEDVETIRKTKQGEKTAQKAKRESFALTFRDVEDSIRSFDGEDDYPIEKWISDFDEIAEITGWNELQKLIFAKRSLKGLAKMFIQSEKGIKTWSTLKKKLKAEFEVKVNSAQIHKLLMARKKKKEESVQEYALIMREIGSRANIENTVVMQYIIDGIQDDTPNKIILYGAKNFVDFKEKLKLYEQMKTAKTYNQNHGFKSKRDGFQGQVKKTNDDGKTKKTQSVLCFNCGTKGHKSTDCPDKGRGTKCFTCNRFGHVAKRCPKKQPTPENASTSSSMTTIEVVPTNSVKLTIDGVQLIALLDTGSDISAIRSDVYNLYFKNIPLDQQFIILKGIGSNKVLTLGSFDKNVIVNDEEITLGIHVLPTEASNFKCIVGNDLLSQVDVRLSDGEMVIFKREKENFLMKITADEYESNLSSIGKHENVDKAIELINKYEPKKIKTTDVKMKIILKNEEPVYHRPRRLSAPEREEVETQIEEWLKEEIIRPSSSDFASALVLVKKKDG